MSEAAESYVRLSLSLAKHQPTLVDAWLGDASLNNGPREPVAQIRGRLAALTAQLGTFAHATDPFEAARQRYLVGQVRALGLAAGRLAGESASFAEEAEHGFGHRPPARDAEALDERRRAMAILLPGNGSLAERYAAFRNAHAVPPVRVQAVFAAAVAWCRERAALRLPLPAGEQMALTAEDTGGWAAFSRPRTGTVSDVWVATRGGADVAHLLQLAAHEGTPGHHAQHVLAWAALVEGRGWRERLLNPSFGPHRLIAEGAAEAAADLLLPLELREQVCREVLLPAAGQSAALAASIVRVERLASALDVEVAHIAADYLDTSLGTEAATTRLRDEALVLDPPGMLAFIEKQRSRVLAYPLGRALVSQAIARGSESDRWARLATVATTLDLGAA